MCCGNCNCIACLRSSALINVSSPLYRLTIHVICCILHLKCGSLQAIKMKTETNNNHEAELSKYMLKELLPHLRRLDEEQMVEKAIEAKRQGTFSSKSLTSCCPFLLAFFSIFLLMCVALPMLHGYIFSLISFGLLT